MHKYFPRYKLFNSLLWGLAGKVLVVGRLQVVGRSLRRGQALLCAEHSQFQWTHHRVQLSLSAMLVAPKGERT